MRKFQPRISIFRIQPLIFTILVIQACTTNKENQPMSSQLEKKKKDVIYQVFPRLFGNTNTTNKPWGTIDENGVGKFSDFSDKALEEIKELGVTYI